jgi:hypothetical protein
MILTPADSQVNGNHRNPRDFAVLLSPDSGISAGEPPHAAKSRPASRPSGPVLPRLLPALDTPVQGTQPTTAPKWMDRRRTEGRTEGQPGLNVETRGITLHRRSTGNKHAYIYRAESTDRKGVR